MSAVDSDNWLATTLDGYAAGVRWVIERKDFNAFWPVGLPRAGTAMGDLLVTQVEEVITANALRATVANPTAALLLLFFSTHGMRVAGWSRERRLHYAQALLALVRASKTTPVVDPDGRHCLLDPPEPWGDAWLEGFHQEANVFCALSWATAEALYFCNHRIGTERHGPYATAGDGQMRMVRSVHDLRPVELWPEIEEWPELPARVDVVFEYDRAGARFDLFANPLFDFDSHAATQRLAILAHTTDGRCEAVRDLTVVAGWNDALRGLLTRVVEQVDAMDERARIGRLHDVMLHAASGLSERRLPLARQAPVSVGIEVRGSVEQLAAYYDFRSEVA